jgi:bacillithiol biosynthesis deacetylase BshB1
MIEIDLLAFAPHPDDAEIWCGGFLAKMATLGYKTAIVDLSAGELSSRGDVESRKKEIVEASKLLNLSHRETLGLPDGKIGIDFKKDEERIVNSLRTLRPKFLIAPYQRERHPDHIRASSLIHSAIFTAGLKKYSGLGENLDIYTPTEVFHYELRYKLEPNFILDISDVFETKLKAIKCYSSQLSSNDSGSKTLLSSDETLEVLEAKAREYGAQIGVRYGEAYKLSHPLGVSDPLKLCGQFPQSKIHFFR